MGIMINASGSRKYHDSNTDLASGEDEKIKSALDETIPTKFWQQTYDHENGYVWLSTCLLERYHQHLKLI